MRKTEEEITEPSLSAFLNLGYTFIKLLQGDSVPNNLIEPIITNYKNISMNVKNCEEGLKSAIHISNLKIDFSVKWEECVIHEFFSCNIQDISTIVVELK